MREAVYTCRERNIFIPLEEPLDQCPVKVHDGRVVGVLEGFTYARDYIDSACNVWSFVRVNDKPLVGGAFCPHDEALPVIICATTLDVLNTLYKLEATPYAEEPRTDLNDY